jgi:hypothetical protein
MHHLNTIQILLRVIDSINIGPSPSEVLGTTLSVLPFTLSTAESLAIQIEQACVKYTGGNKRRHRLKLALLERERVEEISRNLQNEIGKLNLLLQVLTL